MLTDPDKPALGNREHVHEKDWRDQSVYDVAEIFSPPRVCRRARFKDFEVVGVLMTVPRAL